jgi:DNA-binding CsgD family transcriptional regulator
MHTLILDEHGGVIWLSHSDELHEPTQIVGSKVWDLVPLDEREEVRHLLASAVFDDATDAKTFSSKFVEARPRYRVTMQRVQAGAVVATVRREIPGSVTAREREVLRMIAEDVGPARIAKKLQISKNTVESYRRQLKKKLGVTGTAGLIRWAIRSGIVPP